ncbi:MAG TPA: two-component regulator propeller domain-containing protein [Vicinamibacterales bacterium]|nr:two-component regulator propeller domain-containing protein [Vicinamibacterales bacterium]
MGLAAAITLALTFATRPCLVAFHSVPIPDEVPAHLVTTLAQDRDGFLWIGTQAGLVRFDGYTFRTYKADAAANANALSGPYVRSLMVARDGRVWVGTFAEGVSIYDPATDRFTRLAAQTRIEHIVEDRDGTIWLATHNGVDHYDPRTGTTDHFTHSATDPKSLADDRTRGLLIDRGGNVWVGSSRGLQRLRRGTHQFDAFGPPQFVGELYEDARGRIWIGTTDNGAAILDPRTGQYRVLDDVSYFWITGISEAADNEIWVATYGGGVDVYDADTARVIDRLRHDATLPSTIPADRVGALLRDRAGLMWVGTWGDGLTRHDPSSRAFRELRSSPQQPDGLTHPSVVRAMQMRDGTIWAGTDGNGVDVFDAGYHRVRAYRPNARDAGALSDGSITCLAESTDGSTWVATLNGTLHRLRANRQTFERITTATGLPGGPIRAMTEAGGSLWIASAFGLARLDLASNRITAYRHDPNNAASLASNTVESVAATSDGTIWVGTVAGLHALNPATNAIVRITRDPSKADTLPHNWIPDLTIADGRLWLATRGGAAVMTAWDGHAAHFDSVSARLKRPPAPIDSIIEDAAGWMWLGPRLRVNPATWEVQEFSGADGSDFRTFYFASRSRTTTGELLFGSPEGLLVTNPSAIRGWTYSPPLVVTSLHVDGIDQPVHALMNQVSLPPRTRGFQMEFAFLDLSAPERNIYRYRLDGFDRDWSETTAARRSLTYTNLAPGSYTLHVQGSNRAHAWSPQELRIAIAVLPAFYQTSIFRAALGLLLIALGYGTYRIRVRQLQARGRELEQIVRERTAALQDAYARIEEASLTDALTGLRNRRFLEQTIDQDVELVARRARTSQRDGQSDLIFFLLDLDHFKSVNDRFGHAAGDAVLIQTADILRATVRASDYTVRWGGEEFLVVARFIDRSEGATIAEKIRSAVATHTFRLPDGRSHMMTCSIGYAPYPLSTAEPHAAGWEQVIDLADRALYEAKRGGRNRAAATADERLTLS